MWSGGKIRGGNTRDLPIAIRADSTVWEADGNYLWNQENDTILGKQVIISEYMPDIETGTKPIVFGDFSYYWIVGRKPVTVRTLLEKFVLYDQIGYLAFEFLDRKLVRNEAIKVIQMADAGK